MNILALDFGTKRIGMAWTDTDIGVVLPFGVIENDEQGARSKEQLIALFKQEHIQKVVVGLPIGLDGKENENTIRIRGFVEKLESQTEVPFEFYDERFSSQVADRMEGSASRDEKSAVVILEGYLDREKK
jgi:putative Holliday junction resolvase